MSEHWYDRQGKPCYTIIGKNGKERDTTLADARKLGLVPSVTTIIKEAAAPQLEAWKRQQMMLAALTLPRNEGEPESEWLKRVLVDAEETARKAAERGTQIHDMIERGFAGEQLEGDMLAHYEGARRAVEAVYGEREWIAEQSFAHRDGYGGKCDLHCKSIDDKPAVVIDFKTKEFWPDDVPTLKTWDNHAQQIAAYQDGLDVVVDLADDPDGAICYVSSTVPGLAVCIPIPPIELWRGFDMFRALLAYWKAKTRYDPAF